ncbi:hypothetical protein [Sphingomonas mollis]|uniref:Uncharacterized protein n=1 Tax=Sphingomonas mollis TaxID=2795726 RepID=A0ABS0XPI1_9SPHN|nr:hypothetical protein [Sphingomonas sp. BT553]MBJ6121951.1 hypothetical protein [Sphingomonas sp. BT553]
MNGRPPFDDSPSIASPTRGQAFEGDTLELPILIPAALEATGTRVRAFLERLTRGSIWQDQSIRSMDGGVDIQAYLAPEGLRCLIRLGAGVRYQHPGETLDVLGMPLPHIDRDMAVPLVHILPHRLLDGLPILACAATHLNAGRPEVGTSIRVDMPRLLVRR